MPDTSQLYMGFDFGKRYIGVALGRQLTGAQALTSLIAREGIPQWGEVERLVDHWRPQAFIVGLPANDGAMKHIHLCAKRFGLRLSEKYQRELHFIDEHLTSWQVKRDLDIGTRPSAKQLMQANAYSAQIILQDWLNFQKQA